MKVEKLLNIHIPYIRQSTRRNRTDRATRQLNLTAVEQKQHDSRKKTKSKSALLPLPLLILLCFSCHNHVLKR